MTSKYNEAMLERLRAVRAAGGTTREFAKAVGVSYDRLSRAYCLWLGKRKEKK